MSSSSRAGVGFWHLILVGAVALGASFGTRAAVSVSCSIRATGIAFGLYNPLNAAATQSTGTWTMMCTATGSGSAMVIGTLSLSRGSSGSFFPRTMASGINKLAYNIYTTSADAQIMGDGSQGTSVLSQAASVSSGQPHGINGTLYGTLYGNLPPLQDAPPGNYSDALILTVAY